MGWIKDRILSEFKKHQNISWARLSEQKIILSLEDRINKLNTYNAIEEDDCILIKDLKFAILGADE